MVGVRCSRDRWHMSWLEQLRENISSNFEDLDKYGQSGREERTLLLGEKESWARYIYDKEREREIIVINNWHHLIILIIISGVVR